MLRVGLTGGLGSGKSTVADYLRELGAEVIEADELGRDADGAGAAGLRRDCSSIRAGSRRAGWPAEPGAAGGAGLCVAARLNELNAIVHPAVIEAQRRWMDEVFERDPAAVAVVVSALIFEVERDARARGERESVLADWRRRIDRVVVVTAPDELKIARYVARLSLAGADREAAEADARARLAASDSRRREGRTRRLCA